MAARLHCSLFDLIGPHNRPQIVRIVHVAFNAEALGRRNRSMRTD